ncbi:hypothetical protein DP117_21005 [Brasilonema sp. UFV-L1]|uniref:hypothetical protein n=1 Tax=Brasilonema sp. UFV-L1 TaxID=2234130 RepID=UPI00145DBC56|nr:hypothetical protein [Brasilonema sp. UFV-L1]
MYKNAPTSFLDVQEMTSWLYFQHHFDVYLVGEKFPLPQKEEGDEADKEASASSSS